MGHKYRENVERELTLIFGVRSVLIWANYRYTFEIPSSSPWNLSKESPALKAGKIFGHEFQNYLAFRPLRATFAVLNFQNNMANHKATKKDVRQATKRRDRNRYYGKTTRNAIRDLQEIKDNKGAAEKLPEIVAMLDKLAKRGIIHKNKASNIKSKLTRKVNALAK